MEGVPLSAKEEHENIHSTLDMVTNLGHPFLATISTDHYIRMEYKRITVCCTRKRGHDIGMANINVATLSGGHCVPGHMRQRPLQSLVTIDMYKWLAKGRCQNSGDFLQRMTNIGW